MKARVLLGERGSVAVAGMLLTFALALLVGTGVDVAHAFIVRAQLDAIADDAALAGASQLDLDAWRAGRLALDPAAAESAAQAELDANSAVSGAVSADTTSIQVEVSRSFPTYALDLVGIPTLAVSGRAEATPETP
jgi:Flp pilus assembly protein TadG